MSEIADFLTRLLAIERAWALLPADVEEALLLGSASAHVLIRAAELIAPTDPDRAHRLLEQAVQLDAPPAPAQLALSRSFRARGDEAGASRWLRGAMLRARPDAALLLELAAIETDHAAEIVAAAQRFSCRDAVTAADAASALVAYGKLPEARIAGTIAFEAGAREGDFLALYSDLLANPTLSDAATLPEGPLGMPHWWYVGTQAAQARLTAAYPAAPIIARAASREQSAAWLRPDGIGTFLKARIAAAEPFSWIRLGDGEARFLMHIHPELRAALPAREAMAMAKQIWFAWFGQDLDEAPVYSIAALGERLDQAIRNAGLIGVTDEQRLETDAAHYGFCAGLETHLTTLLADQPPRLFCDALAPVWINQLDPFFGSILRELDFLGVVSPHPDLAYRLQRHLKIGAVASYDLPGETRLGRAIEHENRGTHFPEVYERTLAALSVPRPGAVFLVAGGLLGKIYCDRIRELGGIALDIGAVADAWAGYNRRGRLLEQAPVLAP